MKRVHENMIIENEGSAYEDFNNVPNFYEEATTYQLDNFNVKCEPCGKSFSTQGSLRRHVKRFHVNSFNNHNDSSNNEQNNDIEGQSESLHIKCEPCGKSFSTQGSLRRHVKNFHINSINNHNDSTNNEQSNDIDFEVHEGQNDNFHEAIVHTNMNQEENNLENSVQSNYFCKYCGKKFSWKKSLKVHMRNAHAEQNLESENSFCENNESTYTNTNQEENNSENSVQSNYFCKYCGKNYGWKYSLDRHIKSVHEGRQINDENEVEVHDDIEGMEEMSRSFSEGYEDDLEHLNHEGQNKNLKDEIFYCKFCEKGFTWKRSLNRHMKKVHQGVMIENSIVNEFNVENTIENNVYDYEQNQAEQATNVEIPTHSIFGNALTPDIKFPQETSKNEVIMYSCLFCDKNFSWKKSLKLHMKNAHEGQNLESKNPFCENDESTYTNRNQEKNNLENNVQSNYFCKYCGKKYEWKISLNRHIKIVHEGGKEIQKSEYLFNQKTFDCDYCGKTLKNSYQLKRHIRYKHENPQLYTCNLCESTFTQPNSLQRHIENIHEKIKNEKCGYCEQTFYRLDHCKQHMLKYHGVAAPYKFAT